MTSSNGNIFRVTGHLCGEFTGYPVTRSIDAFFDLQPNKRLSKQWWGWWFETPSCTLWRHRNVMLVFWLFPCLQAADQIKPEVSVIYYYHHHHHHYLRRDDSCNFSLPNEAIFETRMLVSFSQWLNTLKPRQNDCHFTDVQGKFLVWKLLYL